MMTDQELLALAKKEGIDVPTLEHESREISFLACIAQDPVLALSLVFKGGTALRLVYLSDRYSDDLDFDSIGSASTQDVFKRLQAIVQQEGLEVVDEKIKRATILLSVRAPGWKRRLKIEVSHLAQLDDIPTVVRNIVSPVFPSSVNVLTYPLPVLLSGKMLAVLQRPDPTPRDLYDLFWLLSLRVEEDSTYMAAVSDTQWSDRRELYSALIDRIDQYKDHQIATELCALLPQKRRAWVRESLKERVKELLRLCVI
jgi:predicted nucleotidyltransferase component of viral defense system